ncbi:hypothetical protein [Paludisphaera soli]|uniref:hypothetical protein n=1 Tax=Paludisphaera soli TaxID=2712865 RepID=UPI0013EDFDAE|nr:hypothetical protein [Paludisphaera soli]
MSWQVVPLKVDWQKFLRSFPKPDCWAEGTTSRLTRDDSGQQDAWVECYAAMRKHLPEETVFAVDWLVQATTLDSLPKWKGFKLPVWYKPHRAFDPEDYQGPGSGCEPVPLMSPGNVVDMLHCLRLREPERVTEDVQVAWARLTDKGWVNDAFEDAGRFLAHFGEWRAVFEEVESEKAGYALDFA